MGRHRYTRRALLQIVGFPGRRRLPRRRERVPGVSEHARQRRRYHLRENTDGGMSARVNLRANPYNLSVSEHARRRQRYRLRENNDGGMSARFAYGNSADWPLSFCSLSPRFLVNARHDSNTPPPLFFIWS